MNKNAHSNVAVNMKRPGNTKEFDYSWNIDHIRPKSSFNDESKAEFENNYEPMQRLNNLQKSDNYPDFLVDDKKYKVIQEGNCYGIIDVETGLRVDWKGRQKREYK